MGYKNILICCLIMLLTNSVFGKAVACKKDSKFFDYCECDFYDSPRVTQKFYVGWVSDEELSNPAVKSKTLVRINGKKYLDFDEKFEKFSQKLGSKGEFLLVRGKDRIKGIVKVISNCTVDTSDKCESVDFAGRVDTIIDGVKSRFKVTGGCGC